MKNLIKRLFTVLLGLGLVSTLVACGPKGKDPVDPTPGPGPVDPSGEKGTCETNPFTVAELIATGDTTANAGSSNKKAEVQFVKGIVLSATYSTQYSNWTIYIADSTDSSVKFKLDGAVIAEGKEITDIHPGQELVGSGNMYYYSNGSLWEFDKGCKVYSAVCKEYQVTCGQCTNGSLSTSITKAVCGTEFTVTATPAEGYVVDVVKANNKAISAEQDGSYKLKVTGPMSITASFKDATAAPVKGKDETLPYTVAEIIATGDSATNTSETTAVDPQFVTGYVLSVSYVAASGDYAEAWTIYIADSMDSTTKFQAYKANVKEGRTISDIHVGSKVVIEGSMYYYATAKIWEFGAGCLIYSVECVEYNVSAETATNGSVSVSKAKANCGETITITATPAEGYEVNEIKVNDKRIEAVESVYSFTVKGNSVVTATFQSANAVVAKATYTFENNKDNGITVGAAAGADYSGSAQSSYYQNEIGLFQEFANTFKNAPDYNQSQNYLTAVSEITKVYAGNGNGGAFANKTNLLKFGSGSAGGKITLTFSANVEKVVVQAHLWYATGNTGDNLSYLKINGVEHTPGEGGTPVETEYVLTSPSKTLTFESYRRVEIFSITVYFHAHTYTFHEAVPATCLEDGLKAYYTCEGCGKTFDENKVEIADEEIEAKLTVAALGHAWPQSTVSCTGSEELTCTREGCGAKQTIVGHHDIDANGHCSNCLQDFVAYIEDASQVKTYYTSLQAAVTAAQAGDEIVVAYAGSACAQITVNKNLTIKGLAKVEFSGWGFRVEDGATLTIAEGEFVAQEACVTVIDGSVVVKGGTFTSKDNAVITGQGSELGTDSAQNIKVEAGTFNGSIQSAGYIAMGVYVANKGRVEITGGTWNIKDGVAFVLRSGNVTIGADVVVNLTHTDAENKISGKAGDGALAIAAGDAIVADYASEYPGGKPVVTNNSELAVKEYYVAGTKARIGFTAFYQTLAAAIEAVKEGETIVLVDDIELSEILFLEKETTYTIDLGGNTISGSVNYVLAVKKGNVTLKNGTISGAKNTISAEGGKLVLDETLKVVALSGTALAVQSADSSKVAIVVTKAEITATNNAAIASNAMRPYIALYVMGGKVTSTNDVAVYMPANLGYIEISGGEFKGTSALFIKGGNFAISGGKFIATLATKATYGALNGWGNGTGDAIIITNEHTLAPEYYGTPDVYIKGLTAASFELADQSAKTILLTRASEQNEMPRVFVLDSGITLEGAQASYFGTAEAPLEAYQFAVIERLLNDTTSVFTFGGEIQDNSKNNQSYGSYFFVLEKSAGYNNVLGNCNLVKVQTYGKAPFGTACGNLVAGQYLVSKGKAKVYYETVETMPTVAEDCILVKSKLAQPVAVEHLTISEVSWNEGFIAKGTAMTFKAVAEEDYVVTVKYGTSVLTASPEGIYTFTFDCSSQLQITCIQSEVSFAQPSAVEHVTMSDFSWTDKVAVGTELSFKAVADEGYTVTVKYGTAKLTADSNNVYKFTFDGTSSLSVTSDKSLSSVKFTYSKGTGTAITSQTASQTGFKWTNNGIVVTDLKGSSSTAVADSYTELRAYVGHNLSIAYSSNISKIVINCSAASYAVATYLSCTNGTITVSETQIIITITNPASEILLTFSKQVRITSIDVCY